ACPHLARHQPQVDESKATGRQHQVAQRIGRHAPLPCQRRVQHEKAGGRPGGKGVRREPPPARQQAELAIKTTRATTPSQKRGTETPATETVRLRWSTHEVRREAEMTPSGTPATTARARAVTTSSRVAGKNRARSSATGRPVRMERPGLPAGGRSHTGRTGQAGAGPGRNEPGSDLPPLPRPAARPGAGPGPPE